ncbi:hypothetical protein CVU37_05025 [candidate division BRC1 bacterium HGW-BRC1-1]|nr:MAG: hypothetical protein CVU37_05025 [candidate division BRC1 bacterium HGW-BRC1-1]
MISGLIAFLKVLRQCYGVGGREFGKGADWGFKEIVKKKVDFAVDKEPTLAVPVQPCKYGKFPGSRRCVFGKPLLQIIPVNNCQLCRVRGVSAPLMWLPPPGNQLPISVVKQPAAPCFFLW